MDDFVGNLLSHLDPRKEKEDEGEKEEEGSTDYLDVNDLREENKMLRNHMEELNSYIITLSNSDKVSLLEKELNHAVELRKTAESYVTTKNTELKHFTNLINEQIIKTKATEEELNDVRNQLVEANLKMLPISKLRSELFESKEAIKEAKHVRNATQKKLEDCALSCLAKDKAIMDLQKDQDELSKSYQKLNLLNMELEGLNASKDSNLMDSKIKIDKLQKEVALLNIRNRELTAQINGLQRTLATSSNNFSADRNYREKNDINTRVRSLDEHENEMVTDEDDLCAPMKTKIANAPKDHKQQNRILSEKASNEAEAMISLIKQQGIDLAQSSSEFFITDCTCGTDVFNKVFCS